MNALFFEFHSGLVVVKFVLPCIWKFSHSHAEGVCDEAGIEHIDEKVTTDIARINVMRQCLVIGFWSC